MSALYKIADKIAYKFSGFNRRRKYRLFLELAQPSKLTTILDIGFQEEEYSDTQNYLEKHYPYQSQITALGHGACASGEKFKQRYPAVKVVTYDGLDFPFSQDSFDMAWSNAVVEHVGGFQRQLKFIQELKRTCQAGFFTTPNRWFPVEVHTKLPLLHYLPKPVFDRLLKLIGKESHTGDYLNLLSKRQLQRLLAQAGISNYRIIRNRIFGLTVDFAVYFSQNGKIL